jgi:hypothetical protein
VPEHAGITADFGPVPDDLAGAARPRPWIQITDSAIRVDFGANRVLLVEDGSRVTVQWDLGEHESESDLAWVVDGWAMTLAAFQRGNLSLHASTVDIGGVVVAVAGHQGAGKSTTSMALRARGHQLLIDDSTLIEFHDAVAWTTPFARNVHLLPDAAAAVGVDFAALPALAGRTDKSSFRPEAVPAVPVRIDHVVVLTTPQSATSVNLTPVAGAQRMAVLQEHVPRRSIAPLVLGNDVLFSRLAQLADAVSVSVLTRPPDAWTLDEVCEHIEALAGQPTPTPAPQ